MPPLSDATNPYVSHPPNYRHNNYHTAIPPPNTSKVATDGSNGYVASK
jgi:hypothetical protein